MLKISGTIKLDKRTKNLAPRLRSGEIALIDHQDIDSVSAQMLIDRRIAAVVNAGLSISGRYPNAGPKMLLNAGIPILDGVGQEPFDRIHEGDQVEISGCELKLNGDVICQGTQLTQADIARMLEESKLNLDSELERFAENTLTYVLQEKSILLDATKLPSVDTGIAGRQVLIVVRGEGYKDDLVSLRVYINEVKPILIGVDGGADALLEMGYKPHMIIGDMDSVSDKALRCGAEIVVHTYTDKSRKAPGVTRLQEMGIETKLAAVPGTSEDVAMLLAYEKGAELIVAVGTHSNLIDFLDKGRKGMSSTFLVRLKVGPKLVDARGASKLYNSSPKLRYAGVLVLAAMAALIAVIALSPAVQDQIRMFIIEQKSRLWDLWVQLRLWER
ncbi:MAG: putative cytokinetic ring protein SteA [Armatimonadota bacterium]